MHRLSVVELRFKTPSRGVVGPNCFFFFYNFYFNMSKRCVIKVERAEKIALQTVWPTGPKGWIQSCFSLSSPWARMPTFYGSSHNFEECVTRQNIVCVGSYKCTLLRALLVFFLSFPPQYNFSDSNNFLIKIFSWISADFPI